jgi:hypothetical protein
MRQNVLDGALLSGLELQAADEVNRRELELLSLGGSASGPGPLPTSRLAAWHGAGGAGTGSRRGARLAATPSLMWWPLGRPSPGPPSAAGPCRRGRPARCRWWCKSTGGSSLCCATRHGSWAGRTIRHHRRSDPTRSIVGWRVGFPSGALDRRLPSQPGRSQHPGNSGAAGHCVQHCGVPCWRSSSIALIRVSATCSSLWIQRHAWAEINRQTDVLTIPHPVMGPATRKTSALPSSDVNRPDTDIKDGDDTDREMQHVAAWMETCRSEDSSHFKWHHRVQRDQDPPRRFAWQRSSAMRLSSEESLFTPHWVRRLFVHVVIKMACADGMSLNAERIEAIINESDPDDGIASECYFLDVACTPTRDHLHVTSGA